MLLSSQSPAVTPLKPPPPQALMARTEVFWRSEWGITASSPNRNYEL